MLTITPTLLAAVFPDDDAWKTAARVRTPTESRVSPSSTRQARHIPLELLPRLQAREEQAYTELLQYAGKTMLELAMVFVKSEDVAEDIVQDVMYRVYTLGGQFRPTSTLMGYLLGAIRHRALHLLRHERIVRQHAERISAEEHADRRGAMAPSTAEIVDDRVLALERELTTLTSHQRAALKLRYEDSLSVAEVAEALGISSHGAAKLLSRVTKHLRERMRNRL